jgi:hypothetical protein
MARFLTKAVGVLLLFATIGVVSCQAVLSEDHAVAPPAATRAAP